MWSGSSAIARRFPVPTCLVALAVLGVACATGCGNEAPGTLGAPAPADVVEDLGNVAGTDAATQEVVQQDATDASATVDATEDAANGADAGLDGANALDAFDGDAGIDTGNDDASPVDISDSATDALSSDVAFDVGVTSLEDGVADVADADTWLEVDLDTVADVPLDAGADVTLVDSVATDADSADAVAPDGDASDAAWTELPSPVTTPCVDVSAPIEVTVASGALTHGVMLADDTLVVTDGKTLLHLLVNGEVAQALDLVPLALDVSAIAASGLEAVWLFDEKQQRLVRASFAAGAWQVGLDLAQGATGTSFSGVAGLDDGDAVLAGGFTSSPFGGVARRVSTTGAVAWEATYPQAASFGAVARRPDDAIVLCGAATAADTEALVTVNGQGKVLANYTSLIYGIAEGGQYSIGKGCDAVVATSQQTCLQYGGVVACTWPGIPALSVVAGGPFDNECYDYDLLGGSGSFDVGGLGGGANYGFLENTFVDMSFCVPYCGDGMTSLSEVTLAGSAKVGLSMQQEKQSCTPGGPLWPCACTTAKSGFGAQRDPIVVIGGDSGALAILGSSGGWGWLYILPAAKSCP